MKRYISSLALFAAAVCYLPALSAGTVTYGQLDFFSPAVNVAYGNDVAISNVYDASSGYTVSAEFCENAYCSSGQTYSFADSYLRFTNVTINCSLSFVSGCGSLDITFSAYNAMSEVFASSIAASVNLALTGSSSLGSLSEAGGSASICFTSLDYICTPNGQGTESFSTYWGIDRTGAIYTYEGNPSGSVLLSNGYDVDGDFQVNGLAAGETVTLPGSFDIGIQSQVGSVPAPEPSSFAFGAAGLALLGTAAMRRRT